jgi:aryl-alcohol dehydrogenase-like predicted oxidoreductase
VVAVHPRHRGEIVPTARELGVGIVPYSPIGRGFLTGQYASIAALDDAMPIGAAAGDRYPEASMGSVKR